MSARIDYTNKTIKFLLVKDVAFVKNEHAHWNVYCMYCNHNRIISSSVLRGGTGKCRWCIHRVFTYLESKQIAKDYVNGFKIRELRNKYKCSGAVIHSAIKLVKG